MKHDYDLYFEERIGQLSEGWGYIRDAGRYYKVVKVGDLQEETEFNGITVPSDIYELFSLMGNIVEDE